MKALALIPGFIDLERALAFALRRSGLSGPTLTLLKWFDRTEPSLITAAKKKCFGKFLRPLAKAYYGSALLAYREKEFSVSEAIARDCASLDPTNSQYHVLVGKDLSAQGNLAAAAESFQQAIRLDGTLTAAYGGVLPFLAEREPKPARQLAEQCRSLNPCAESELFLCLLAVRQGDFENARQKFLDCVEVLGIYDRAMVRQHGKRGSDPLPLLKELAAQPLWSLETLLDSFAELTFSELRKVLDPKKKTLVLLNILDVGSIFRDYFAPFTLFKDLYNIVLVVGSDKDPGQTPFPHFHIEPQMLRRMDLVDLVVCDGPPGGPLLREGQRSLLLFHGAVLPPTPKADGYNYFDYCFGCTKVSMETAVDRMRYYRSKDRKNVRRILSEWDGRRRGKPERTRVRRNFLIPTPNLKLQFAPSAPTRVPERKRITFIPTNPTEFPPGGSAFHSAPAVIESLLANLPDYEILYRPFVWLVGEPEFLEVKRRFGNNPRVVIDLESGSTQKLYEKSSVVLTDASSGGFSFIAQTRRASVFYIPDEIIRSSPLWKRYADYCARYAFFAGSIDAISAAVKESEAHPRAFQERIDRFRREQFYGFEDVQRNLRENIEAIMEDKVRPDWIRV